MRRHCIICRLPSGVCAGTSGTVGRMAVDSVTSGSVGCPGCSECSSERVGSGSVITPLGSDGAGAAEEGTSEGTYSEEENSEET